LRPEGTAQRGLAALGVDAKGLVRRLRGVGLGWVPRLLPQRLKGAVPQSLSSFSKVADRIDWRRTRAYCPSAPGSGLWVNLRGREPEGIVAPGAEAEDPALEHALQGG